MSAFRLFLTSTFRLALVYVALFGGSVLVLFAFLYWSTAGYMARQTDETIGAEIAGLAEQYRQRGLEGLAAVIAERVRRNPEGRSIYLLARPNFTRLVGNLDRWPAAPEDRDAWMDLTIKDADSPRGEAYPARARHIVLPGGFHLLVGRDIEERTRVQRLVVEAFGWGLAITLVLAIAGALVMSRLTLQRLEAINRACRDIMAGDLSRRVPMRGAGDEYGRLAANLNAMLDRIEQLMGSIRAVSDNIAHDLRGPLTRMRARLEEARVHPPASADVRPLIDATIAEADTLLATFNALLRIAEIEAGTSRPGFAPVDLAGLVRDAAELYEPVAQEKGVALGVAIAADVAVEGDRHLLAQALANLLDNAIKYTPSGGRVSVTLRTGEHGPEIEVGDSGPGIPAAYHDKVTERFFRMEASRSTPGSGLGLSLVAAVARLHGARLALAENAPGLRAMLAFPAAPRG